MFSGEEGIFYTDQSLSVSQSGPGSVAGSIADQAPRNEWIQGRFRQFLKEWTSKETFIYVERLRANYSMGKYFLQVDLNHLQQFDEDLYNKLIDAPTKFLPLIEDAAKEVLDFTTNKNDLHDIQVHLNGFERHTTLRALGSQDISKLVNIPGIVISASRVRPKAQRMAIQCRNCSDVRYLTSPNGFGNAQVPRFCTGAVNTDARSAGAAGCPIDPYVVVPELSSFIDYQSIKLQERPEMVPTGDMPRHMACWVDRNLANQVIPGARVSLTGIYCMQDSGRQKAGNDKNSNSFPYLRVIGIASENDNSVMFSAADEQEMLELSRTRGIYQKLAKSIAPRIWGHADIKKAIACMMFGGSRKVLPDGMRLRGDINMLLLGDPSVAKSQFLKFVEQVAPIAVYTSGKGSSAAGLTASVIRDASTREFHLEAGALVLADGGIVCIDEFDKMNENDRVAIHEAMEQQTISIAKAGITTILNSRTSILAAANPIYGRYDTERTASENISLQTTILSRFDMIFVILDTHDEDSDARVSQFVINIHKQNNQMDVDDAELVPIDTIKKYIAFCRQRCHPRLSPDACVTLRNHYVNIRSGIAKIKKESGDAPIPITVRQLEAITRIAESLARIELSPVANTGHVAEAIRLFKVSTVQAGNTGQIAQGSGSVEFRAQTQRAEDFIRARVPNNHRVGRQHLLQQYLRALDIDSVSPFTKAIEIMTHRGEIRVEDQNRSIRRIR